VLIAVRQSRQRRDAAAAREEQLGRSTAGLSKYYRLYLYSGKIILAAMYLLRVRVAGRSFAAALANHPTVVTSHAPAAQISVRASGGSKRSRRSEEEEQFGRCTAEKIKYYRSIFTVVN
jgi:hypothetical protein